MSSRTRLALALCLAFVGAGIVSSPAYAQSAISGVVKDESGAVMPGVSVEAASDGPDREGARGRHRRERCLPHDRSAPRQLRPDVHAAGLQRDQARARAALELRRHDQRRTQGGHAAGIGDGVGTVAAGGRAEQRQAAGDDAATCSTPCRPPAPSRASASSCPA